MSSDVLEKVKQLPPDKQKEVEDFIDDLLQKYNAENAMETVADIRRKNMGWAKGAVWVAEDFDKTPDEFKDYL